MKRKKNPPDHESEIERLKSRLFASGEMEKILDNSYDGIWITDGQGRVLYVNTTNELMLGIRREEVIGRTSEELIRNKLFESSAPLEVIKSKKAVSIMGYNYKTKKNVLITGNPIFDENGNIKYIITNVRDVSQINKMMDEIKQKDALIDQQRQEIENLLLVKRAAEENSDIIAVSASMKKALELAQRVSRFNSTVLVLGESGVGKEIIVRNIVRLSDRADRPFIKVNCGAIPENLLESELFGYNKGAFTGADQKGKMGMFELANSGTIFLDEIGEMPFNLQVKLLRALQEKEIVRVGGVKPIKLDVRVIAATNQNLAEMVSQGSFRTDLYYRLNVVSIHIPPLRERTESIPQLIHHFLALINNKHRVNRVITPQAMQALAAYDWPGNVRELQNAIENLVVMAPGDTIDLDLLDEKFTRTVEKLTLIPDKILPLKDAVRRVESDLIGRALKEYKTTRSAAAVLGVDQSTIVRKLKFLREKNQGN
ncbi:MAG: sigma 54-interacting transcriptional regulator [Deltaproteobacteria bacterium]|jgi:PAS domain S-box-containing protein|nr:sigma 54-interacting transcriptional regulator [Deltaproteobacteria bacterium]